MTWQGEEAVRKSVELGIEADRDIVAFLEEKGMEVNAADIAAFTAASEEIWSNWVAERGDDAQKLVDLIRASAQ